MKCCKVVKQNFNGNGLIDLLLFSFENTINIFVIVKSIFFFFFGNPTFMVNGRIIDLILEFQNPTQGRH